MPLTAIEDYLLRECLPSFARPVSMDANTEIQSDGSRSSTASSSEIDAEAIVEISHWPCLQLLEFPDFLLRKGEALMMRNLNSKDRICRAFLAMAENVQVLKPANDRLAWDILRVSLWQDSLCELISEMKIVKELENFQVPIIGNQACMCSPHRHTPAFLRGLAAEIADRH